MRRAFQTRGGIRANGRRAASQLQVDVVGRDATRHFGGDATTVQLLRQKLP